MSVALVNGSVILPTRPNWRDTVTWKRSWQTTIAGALQGQEDRRALRRIPRVMLNWLITTLSTEESAVLETRINAALKSGLACTGYWGHAAEIASDVTGTSAAIEPGSWPWAAGDYVLFIDPTTGTFDAIKVDSVSGSTLTLHTSVSQTYKACWLCWPIIFGKLQCDPLAPFTSDKVDVKLTLLNALPSPATVPASADWCGHCNAASQPIFAPCPTITISGMPTAGTFGSALTGQLTASGGSGSYTFAITSGTQPTGSGMNSAGAWSGTLSALGTFTGVVTATDTATGCTGIASFSITISCIAMNAPTGLQVDGHACPTAIFNSLTPTLTWGAVTGAASYQVKIYSGSCGGTLLHTSPTLSSATYTVPGGVLTNMCTPYYWTVTATASTGYCSNETSACCEMVNNPSASPCVDCGGGQGAASVSGWVNLAFPSPNMNGSYPFDNFNSGGCTWSWDFPPALQDPVCHTKIGLTVSWTGSDWHVILKECGGDSFETMITSALQCCNGVITGSVHVVLGADSASADISFGGG